MGPLFNPRRMARTPGFAQEGLYDELDMAEQDDYERALPPPTGVRQSNPLPDAAQFDDAPLPIREMRESPSNSPLPPPMQVMREYDGGPSVDPGPQQQARQRITLDPMPLPPKTGVLRKILGGVASIYAPMFADEIAAPGYKRQVQEWEANKQRMMDEGKLNIQAADEEQKRAHAGAEGSRSAAEQARRRKLDADAGYVGRRPIAVNRNERLYDPTAGKVLLDAEESAEKLPTTFESYAVKALSIEDPAEREAALKRTTEAYNILHPEKPITQIKVGGNGEIVAVTVDPKKVAAAGGSMTVGQVTPKAVKASAADERKAEEASGDDVLIADLISENPRSDWNRLGVKEQNRLRSKLLVKGWTEPVKLTERQQKSIDTMDVLVPKIQSILDEYDKTGEISGTGLVVGRLPSSVVSQRGQKNRVKMGDVFSLVANLRSGGAIPEPEMERLDAFLASQDKSDSFNVNALKDLLGSFERSRSSMLKRPTAGGGAKPPVTPTDTSGTVRMRHPNGSIRLVPAKDVAAAEAANYKRVQ